MTLLPVKAASFGQVVVARRGGDEVRARLAIPAYGTQLRRGPNAKGRAACAECSASGSRRQLGPRFVRPPLLPRGVVRARPEGARAVSRRIAGDLRGSNRGPRDG